SIQLVNRNPLVIRVRLRDVAGAGGNGRDAGLRKNRGVAKPRRANTFSARVFQRANEWMRRLGEERLRLARFDDKAGKALVYLIHERLRVLRGNGADVHGGLA